MSQCPGSRPGWPYLCVRTAWCLRRSSFFCLFSALVRTAGCLSLSPSFVLAKALHVGFFFFSSYSYSAFFVFVRVKLERLRLSRQAVKFGHMALFECFDKPGWATTSRCDKYVISRPLTWFSRATTLTGLPSIAGLSTIIMSLRGLAVAIGDRAMWSDPGEIGCCAMLTGCGEDRWGLLTETSWGLTTLTGAWDIVANGLGGCCLKKKIKK